MFHNFFLSFFFLISTAHCAFESINDGKFLLTTTLIPDLNNVLMLDITAETTGYVDIGVSNNGSFMGADLLMAGFNSAKNASYSGDYFGGALPPILDDAQNVYTISASENETHTVVRVFRLLKSPDTEQDVDVEDRTQFILWAMGNSDNVSDPHSTENRGVIEMNLMS